MNYLAHLYLAGGNEALMLGGLLGDFVRGRRVLRTFPPEIASGIGLHRKIDSFTDRSREVRELKRRFPKPFRRFAGIVIDLGFDHELARRWDDFSEVSLEDFDREVRHILARHRDLVPDGLERFMRYADRRGLFAAYRNEEEMLHSLRGIGTRLTRPNPLHRTAEVWPALRGDWREAFELFFPRLQKSVAGWRSLRSTSTGS